MRFLLFTSDGLSILSSADSDNLHNSLGLAQLYSLINLYEYYSQRIRNHASNLYLCVSCILVFPIHDLVNLEYPTVQSQPNQPIPNHTDATFPEQIAVP